ncbi:MAG: PIN domain-containing protein [Euryarchaeota archaeon]|nr:PIN domain-containing protein [Euryarchaeota archaeon]
MGLKLGGLLPDEKVFIDANIFLYSAFQHPVLGNNCKDFLVRVEKGEIIGHTSDFVLNEVFHKLMIAEVVKKFEKTAKQAISLIKKKPEVIAELETIWVEMGIIKSFNISILDGSLFPDFVEMSKKYWLMATDAFHVATMKRYGITNIATNDPDFERVDWINVWKP